MNGPLCRVRRSELFLAYALDATKTPAERAEFWKQGDREFWFESVSFRGLPIMSVPIDCIAYVRKLLFERHEGPLSGTQIRP